MTKRSLNLWVPMDVWMQVHHLKEEEGFEPSDFFVKVFSDMNQIDTNSLDEQNLLSEISSLRNHILNRQEVLQEKLVYFHKLKAEREVERKKHIQVVEMNADLMRRQRR